MDYKLFTNVIWCRLLVKWQQDHFEPKYYLKVWHMIYTKVKENIWLFIFKLDRTGSVSVPSLVTFG